MTAAAVTAVPARRMSTLEQVYLAFYWLSTNVLWGAVLSILVPAQVSKMVPDAIQGTITGVAISLGSITGMLLPPFMGAWSDRARFKLGRRRPFMLIGTAINLVGLMGMAYFPFLGASPLWGVTVAFWLFVAAYLVANFGSNFATAPFSALMPDVVPQDQRGTAAGWLGLMTILGSGVGIFAAGQIVKSSDPLPLFMNQIFTVYGIIGAVLVVGVLVTVLGTKETPIREAKPFRWKELWRGLITPLRNRDFFWVFFTRLLMTMGFITIQSFLLFYLRDVTVTFQAFGRTLASTPEEAETWVLLILLLFAVFSTLSSGQISDRIGRKPLVYVSGASMSLVAIGLIVAHQYDASLIIGALFGIGYGAYTSVDWALATDVLPQVDDAAKDMGIWHIALTFPQLAAVPIAGVLRDVGQSYGKLHGLPTLGYTLIFIIAIIYFILGTVFVTRVKKAR